MGYDYHVPETISERIYAVLKKRIILAEFKPGQKLTEISTAKLFKVSPTPVREAFRKLAGEKYLIINSRREVIVPTVTHAEIKELFEILTSLDALAIRNTLKKISEKDIVDLRDLTDALGRYCQKGNLASYMAKNYEIHDKIWRNCGNNLLYNLLTELGEKATFYNVQMYKKEKVRMSESYKYHLQLMEAIEKKDFTNAAKISKKHWYDMWYFEIHNSRAKKNQRLEK